MGRGELRLAPLAATMGTAEGFETAFAAQLMFDVLMWACLGVERLPFIAFPAEVKRLIVFADPTQSGANEPKSAAPTIARSRLRFASPTGTRTSPRSTSGVIASERQRSLGPRRERKHVSTESLLPARTTASLTSR